ncbi:hypothetical protein WDJ51_14195 [Rathayibacter sp. YIM 133350]|uniref:hypothetical protein n=1 Tax=Rathayibacter sp. YIM 133350 TaxID=3131992 RepID=UPI00307D5A9D
MRRAALLGCAVLGLGLLCACTGAPAATPTTAARVTATAAIYQGRTDYTRGAFSLAVTNTGDTPLTVKGATLTSPSFASPAAYAGAPVNLDPGQRVDLSVAIPPLSCTGAADLGTVDLQTSAGETTTRPTDENDVIDRLVREGCLVHDVDAVVSVTPPQALRVDGVGADAVAHIDLGFTPTGAAGSASFDGIRSTTLLSPTSGENWTLGFTVDASSAARVVTLDVRPTRCDPHALADDKVGTVLQLDARTATGRSGRYQLPMPPTVKAALYDYISAVCGN